MLLPGEILYRVVARARAQAEHPMLKWCTGPQGGCSVNYYEILGVVEDATSQEIRAAYRRAAQLHHPDRGGSHRAMAQVNEAYGVLSDPDQRKEYNSWLKGDKTLADSDPKAPRGPAAGPPRSPEPPNQPGRAGWGTPVPTGLSSVTWYGCVVPVVFLVWCAIFGSVLTWLRIPNRPYFWPVVLASGILAWRTSRWIKRKWF